MNKIIRRIKDTPPEKAILQIHKPTHHGNVHVELFRYKNGWMIHRHTLTNDEKFAALHPVKRAILGWWYCTQEIMLLDDELGSIVGLIAMIAPERLSEMIGEFDFLLNQKQPTKP